jgi:DNA-binding NarL/FixJ family response regulator
MEIKVVIFEDNNSMRGGLMQLINGTNGLICTGAYANCEDLIHRVEKSCPDVILMDIGMPGLSGIEGVKLIKNKFPEIKILMQTIFEDDKKIFESICAGAEGYILKNTSPSEILDAIKEIHEGGSPMTPSIANRVLKMLKKNQSPEEADFNLTSREKEILLCLVRGLSYKLIADACTISIETVNVHIKNIYKKLHVHSKSQAVAKAIKGNLL